MTGLPVGWAQSRLADWLDISTGKLDANAATENGQYPFFTCAEQVSRIDTFAFDCEAVLLAGNGNFNLHKHTGKFNAYQRTYVLQPREVDLGFTFVALNSLLPEITKDNRGSTIKYLRLGDIADTAAPLPPLPEQRRIVHKLDTLSARSTTARAHLTAIEKLVERYRTAFLEVEFKSAWDAGCNTTIAGCLEHAETGLVRSKAEQTQDEGYPYIRMNHYDLAGRWNDRDLTHVAAPTSEFDRYQLRADDLLFNTRNSAELVGKVAIWPAGREGYLFNNNLLRMRFSPDMVPAFAFWQMSSPPFRRYIEGFISATTSVAAIYQRSLMAAPFWVPDPEAQREIVRRIETAFAKIDRLAAEAAKALKLLGHLDQRILAKVFAGDLVPQDPTDEPAEVLLERIREARAGTGKSARGRRKASA